MELKTKKAIHTSRCQTQLVLQDCISSRHMLKVPFRFCVRYEKSSCHKTFQTCTSYKTLFETINTHLDNDENVWDYTVHSFKWEDTYKLWYLS